MMFIDTCLLMLSCQAHFIRTIRGETIYESKTKVAVQSVCLRIHCYLYLLKCARKMSVHSYGI